MEYRTEGSPAPGALTQVQGFLNTWSDELAIEDLPTAKAAETWLREADLWSGRQRLSESDWQRIVAFRTELRSFMQHPEGLDALNELTSSIRFGIELTVAGEYALQPQGEGSDRALGALIAVICNSMASGTWQRLRCCALPTCGWAFYDNTRSRTRRWCSMNTCGSRHKARQYYKRKTAAKSQPSSAD